jgi:protein-S-isoprenylcysteine O-methyltransferase Ste14
MDLQKLAVYVGIGGFIFWSLIERGFSFTQYQQQQRKAKVQFSYWFISLFWYGAILFSILDAWRMNLTVFNRPNLFLRILGVLLTISGLIIRFLARKDLGKEYSVQVETYDQHKLITDGIYKTLRHPAYLGLLCLFLGIPLSEGSWGGIVLAIAGGFPAVIYRIILEEQFLRQWFGEQYESYKAHTWRVIPHVW